MASDRPATFAASFLVIGGQRCSTGWIAQCLREHPDVYMAPDETHFFDRNAERGAGWWHETYFRGAEGHRAVGEKTAAYLAAPDAAGRIARYAPDIKLICCLRDPVTRFESDLVMKADQTARQMAVSDILATRPELFMRGQYAAHLQVYLDLFSPQNLLVLCYEDRAADPAAFMRRIYRFLEIDETVTPASLTLQTKPGAFENSSPLMRKLGRYLTHPRLPLKHVYSALRPRQTAAILSAADRQKLADLYQADRKALEALLGRPFDAWAGPGDVAV